MTKTKAYWENIQIQTSNDAERPQSAVPRDIASLIGNLRSNYAKNMAKLQARWVALSVCRNSEAQFIKHCEINLDDMTWTIPAERRKTGQDHVVPITEAMSALLLEAAKNQPALADYVFVAQGSLLKAAKGVGEKSLRSAFVEWALSEGKFPVELIEAQLGRRPSTTATAQSRKKMMEAWAAHLMGDANV